MPRCDNKQGIQVTQKEVKAVALLICSLMKTKALRAMLVSFCKPHLVIS